MLILLDENNHVSSYSFDEDEESLMIRVDDEIVPDDWDENAFYYIYDGEIFILDKEYKKVIENVNLVYDIRKHREETCFPIINRGGLWYDLLTEEQRSEMLDWYIAWLDAPETLIEPEMPEWLKEIT